MIAMPVAYSLKKELQKRDIFFLHMQKIFLVKTFPEGIFFANMGFIFPHSSL